MDKYTVDLDKVLNDFEYSELTEQSNGFSSAVTQPQQQSFNTYAGPNSGPNHTYTKATYSYESTQPPYSKVSVNSSAKHTINNVFHSLNEYLNSDIRADLDEAASGSSLANIKEIEADIPSLVVRKTSADRLADVAKIQDLFKTITKEDENNVVTIGDGCGAVSSVPAVGGAPSLADVKTINNNINSELNLNRVKTSNVQLDDENLSVKVENTSVNHVQRDKNNIGKGRSHAENLEKHNNAPSLNAVVTITENASLKSEQSNNINVNSLVHVEAINNNVGTTTAIVEKINNTDENTSSNVDGPSLVLPDDGQTLSQQPDATNKQLTDDTLVMETAAVLDKQTVETKVVDDDDDDASTVQPIGFEDVDISDSEMESALAELEEEYNTQVDNNLLENTSNAADLDEFSEQKDLQTELEEVTGVKRACIDSTVMLATHETEPTETGVTLVTDTANVAEINKNIQHIETDASDNVREVNDSSEDGFKAIADKMIETKERIEKRMQVRRETSQNGQQDTNDNSENNRETTADSQSKGDFKTFINKIQETKDRIEKNRRIMNRNNDTKQGKEQATETVDKHVQISQENAQDNPAMQQSKEIYENTKFQIDKRNVPITIETPDGSVTAENTASPVIIQPEPQNTEPKSANSAGAGEEIQDTPVITIQADEASADVSVERRNSTLLRPNSLDLTTEQPTDTLTINLIGEPGSTPYNNVYMESTLKPTHNTQTNTLPEADVEASTSLSPTLSDASTYENTDSPNTSDSCNDTSFDEPPGDKTTAAAAAATVESAPGQQSVEPAATAVAEPAANPGTTAQGSLLGKTAPFWTPDSDALCCLHCNQKFTVLRRRHHCRACGLVLCAKCSNMKYKLEYMDNLESRVCLKCYDILNKEAAAASSSSGSDHSPAHSPPGPRAGLNPNNPMDYCSTVPPHQQVGNVPNQPPTVMVPVGVLKRKGSGKSRSGKSVMFCDGIRPGCDLTELDRDFNYKDQQQQQLAESGTTSTAKRASNNVNTTGRANRNLPKIDTKTLSYIPSEENSLPPIVNVLKSDIFYADCSNNSSVVEMLKQETITFALQRNLHVQVRIINMDCCINKQAWCFTTDGMIAVGQDEIVVLLECTDNEKTVPKDVFLHLSHIYNDAVKGTSITELGLSVHPSSNFLDSKNHVGLLFVKPTFQCIQNVILPKEPYLVGILIHRWETPWAKIFPLRLLLRLGAEYRYYPSPIISTRHRESVYVEIGHTIINLLADFRNFSYTIPSVRGLTIHMEEKNTTVSIPINRYDQVIKALNNSSDHILAFAANFSPKADSHLVCIQDTHGNNENAYTTHAINIHNKPRKVTGASFIVLNGALKSSSGLTAKSSIIEDGLMIQILPDQMVKLRASLRNMKDFKIQCGCVNAQSDESVSILWTENDTNFNVGVTSPIDSTSMAGIPSIRVHNGKDYVCNSGNKMIRWTEVFIIQSGEENARTQDPVDISKVSESISKATCQALVKYLDLLATNSFTKIAIRTTLHVENVSYLAGSNNTKLPPIYMKSLDNELVPILHKITTNNFGEQAVILELVFHILNM